MDGVKKEKDTTVCDPVNAEKESVLSALYVKENFSHRWCIRDIVQVR